LVVGLLAPELALAQPRLEPLPVNVAFEFNSSLGRLRRHYDDPDQTEAEIACKLIKVLNKPDYSFNFRWKFRARDHRVEIGQPGGVPATPVLKVSLTERSGVSKAWIMEVKLYDRMGESPEPARAEVLQPFDQQIGIVKAPGPEELPDQIAAWFEDKFVAPERGNRLHKKLRERAPIGEGLVLTVNTPLRKADDAKGVLLLDFDRFLSYSRWRFQAECPAGPRHAPIRLISEGTGEAYPYRPDGPNGREVLAILVQHKSIIDGQAFPVADKLDLFANLKQASFFLMSPPGPYVEPVATGGPDRLQSADELIGTGGM
jgi:hypothetical protein